MKNLLVIVVAYFSAYTGVVNQPPVKKLVFTGHKYEYERQKRQSEILLSDTYPYDMTKEYKAFKEDSIKIMQDSSNRQSKLKFIKKKNK